jgi:hypothetical protein
MWTQALRRATIALLVLGMLGACKKDKPTEPPGDNEPDPTADVRPAR